MYKGKNGSISIPKDHEHFNIWCKTKTLESKNEIILILFMMLINTT